MVEHKNSLEDYLEGEKWLPITWVHPRYEVSNIGRIRSLDWAGSGKTRVLKTRIGKKGYSKIQLYIGKRIGEGGRRKSYLVHRLVGLAWLDNWMDLPEINHINFIKHDNRVENLEWVTGEQNIAHAVAGGHGGCNTGIPKVKKVRVERQRAEPKVYIKKGPRSNKGELNPAAKISEEFVKHIRSTYDSSKMTQREWAEHFGLKHKHFEKIINREIWKHV